SCGRSSRRRTARGRAVAPAGSPRAPPRCGQRRRTGRRGQRGSRLEAPRLGHRSDVATETVRGARLPRLRALPWRRIIVATVLVLVLIGAVPPLRRAVADGLSKVILLAASPFAPSISGFDDLPETTKVLA